LAELITEWHDGLNELGVLLIVILGCIAVDLFELNRGGQSGFGVDWVDLE
jgi:hypothetical protein